MSRCNRRFTSYAAVVLLYALFIAFLQLYRPNLDSQLNHLKANAPEPLTSNGFKYVLEALLYNPTFFISVPTTIFAFPDSTFSSNNTTTTTILPNITINHLIRYHTSPSKHTFQVLFKKPINTCLPTMFRRQMIAITKRDDQKRLLQINNVLITHPDLYVHGFLAIHGVAGPFASFLHNRSITQLPVCQNKVVVNSTRSSIGRFIAVKLGFNNTKDPLNDVLINLLIHNRF